MDDDGEMLATAIRVCGSEIALARLCGVSRQTIYNWRTKGLSKLGAAMVREVLRAKEAA